MLFIFIDETTDLQFSKKVELDEYIDLCNQNASQDGECCPGCGEVPPGPSPCTAAFVTPVTGDDLCLVLKSL